MQKQLELEWSPEQISHRLVLEHPDDPVMRISHEAIYRTLFIPTRAELPKRLTRQLRTGRTMRAPKVARPSSGRGRLRDMASIHDRSDEARDRKVPGHWEGDLVMGRRPSAVATVVERTSRYLLLLALPAGVTADAVHPVLAAALNTVPPALRRSLTWDRGREMAAHMKLTADTKCPVYFCDPKSPWQRGTNENTNRLLRQYLPSSRDLRTHDQAALNAFAERLNHRPRKTLGWRTPAEVYAKHCASPHHDPAGGDVELLAPAVCRTRDEDIAPAMRASDQAIGCRNSSRFP